METLYFSWPKLFIIWPCKQGFSVLFNFRLNKNQIIIMNSQTKTSWSKEATQNGFWVVNSTDLSRLLSSENGHSEAMKFCLGFMVSLSIILLCLYIKKGKAMVWCKLKNKKCYVLFHISCVFCIQSNLQYHLKLPFLGLLSNFYTVPPHTTPYI